MTTYQERKNKREKIVLSLVMQIPATLPSGLLAFVNDQLPHYLLYNTKSGFAYCTHCKHEMSLIGLQELKHKESKKCPICRVELSLRNLRLYKDGRILIDKADVRFLQKTKKGIACIRRLRFSMCCYREVDKGRVELQQEELQAVFNNGIKIVKCHPAFDTGRPQWIESQRDSFCFGSPWTSALVREYEFDKNLNRALCGSDLQYAQRNMSMSYYAVWTKKVEMIEKAGMLKLSQEILNGSAEGINLRGKTAAEILNIPVQYLHLARKGNFGYRELQSLRDLTEYSVPITNENVQLFAKLGTGWKEVHKTCPTLPLQKYLHICDKQGYWMYRDYLAVCARQGYNMKSKNILYPKNVKEAHDREVARETVLLDQQTDEKIKTRFEESNKKYYFKQSGLSIRPPHDMKELLLEGSCLSHCVAGYATKVASGMTDILFIRKDEDPSTPYITVEFNEGEIHQARGYDNCAPDEAVNRFLSTWQNAKVKKKKQSKMSIAS